MIQKTHHPFLYMLLFMAAVALLRILNAAEVTPWSSFTPIGAMALFGGVNGRGWHAYAFPIITLFASDLFINVVIFEGEFGILHGGFYWIYASIALIVLIGRLLSRRLNAATLLGASIVSTLIFWGVVDFGVWLGGGADIRTMQPLARNWSGLLQCYIQGFPFIKNFLLGTMVYGAILFGADKVYQSISRKRNTNNLQAYAD
jgi:hypothetical protein